MASLTLYGSDVASTVAPTTACQMSTTTGGTETSKNTTFSGGSSIWGELTSKGGTVATTATIPSPTGKGWVYSPGAGTFAAGNWSAACNIGSGNGALATANEIRFYRYSSGTYTLIGTISNNNGTAGKTLVNFAATSMATITFAAGDLLYVDVWWQDNASQADGDVGTIYESSSATAGVANDVQVTTASFTASGGSPISLIAHGAGLAAPSATLVTQKVNSISGSPLATPQATLVAQKVLHTSVSGLAAPSATLVVQRVLAAHGAGLAPASAQAIAQKVCRITGTPLATPQATLLAASGAVTLQAQVSAFFPTRATLIAQKALRGSGSGLAVPRAVLIPAIVLRATGGPLGASHAQLVTQKPMQATVTSTFQVFATLNTGRAVVGLTPDFPHHRFAHHG